VHVTIDARPQPLSVDPRETAVIAVDMQNDFGAHGGMFASNGLPIDAARATIAPTSRVLDAARTAGMTIVYLKMEFARDLSNLGGPDAPNREKHLGFGVGASNFLIEGTWNTEIVPELAPQPGDVVISKHRYSGFFQTELDHVLREREIRNLVFVGWTTSVCVESTLRDAFFRDYRSLVLSDCTAEVVGSDLVRTNHEASLLVIEALSAGSQSRNRSCGCLHRCLCRRQRGDHTVQLGPRRSARAGPGRPGSMRPVADASTRWSWSAPAACPVKWSAQDPRGHSPTG